MLFVAAYVLSVADLRVLSGLICEILYPIPCWVARDIISSPYLYNINHPPVVGVLTHVCDHSGLFNIRGMGLPSSSFCCLNMCEHCVPS